MFSLSSPPYSLNKWYLQRFELTLDVVCYCTFSPNLDEFYNRTHHSPCFFFILKKYIALGSPLSTVTIELRWLGEDSIESNSFFWLMHFCNFRWLCKNQESLTLCRNLIKIKESDFLIDLINRSQAHVLPLEPSLFNSMELVETSPPQEIWSSSSLFSLYKLKTKAPLLWDGNRIRSSLPFRQVKTKHAFHLQSKNRPKH